MKKENNLALGISEPEKVDDYMNRLEHPMKEVAEELRKIILSTNKNIGEGIYWNAPTYFFTGKMKSFNPKEYKRYIVGFNFFKPNCIRLIFLRVADATNTSNLLEGDYKDGRRIASIISMEDLKKKEKDFMKIIKELVARIDD